MKILVSGGTSGIGYEIAAQLLSQGHDLALIGREGLSEDRQKALTRISPKFQVFNCDLGKAGEVTSLGREILQKFGCPDILVNNAGYATYETFEEMSVETIEDLVSVNLMGAVRLTKVLLPQMIVRGSGQILNVSSIAGEIVMTPNLMYMASKQAMNAWSQGLGYELSVHGIQVKTFCPGRVDTAFFNHPTFQKRLQRPEMKAALSAKAVAEKAVELLNSKSRKSFIPGHYRLIAWIYQAVPGVEKFLFSRLMKKRVKDHYSIRGDEHEGEMSGLQQRGH